MVQLTTMEQLDQDLAKSMKAGDATRTGVLRLLRSSLKNEQIKYGHELSEAEVLKVLQREAKQRRDSITAYNDANRPELAKEEEVELGIIADYLPEALSDEELSKLVDEVIAELGNPGPAAMGQVIGAIMAKAGARAEGGAVSKVVREKLV
jgi:uncharacterized protein YqeY